jgi:hypothetical protein
MSWCCAGLLVLGTGCTIFENGAAGGANVASPEPGTRAYFDQKIRGSYAFDNGELVKIYSSTGTLGMPAAPGMIRSSSAYSSFYVQQLEGRALQVISNNLVVLGKSVTNVSGVVTFQRRCLVSLAGTRPPQQGEYLRVLARSDGSFTYNDGTRSGTLTAYREVPGPTFEDYLKIYQRDSQAAAVPPIISVERVAISQLLPPGLVRTGAVMPSAPATPPSTPSMPSALATPASTNQSALLTSYRERLNERRKAQEKEKQETELKQKEALSKIVTDALRKQQEEAAAQAQPVKTNPEPAPIARPLPPGVMSPSPLPPIPLTPGAAPRPVALPAPAPLPPPSNISTHAAP